MELLVILMICLIVGIFFTDAEDADVFGYTVLFVMFLGWLILGLF